jgi:glucose-1-phosphate thymidylyltransferase
VKAIILAAGYATRLSPLTDTVAKPLLPVGGRPMVDEICDRIDAVPAVDELHVVTNSRFAGAFSAWGDARQGRLAPIVHDDGTSSNDDRLGAIGDIRFTVEEAGLGDDDLLVVAGDNLFEFPLEGLVASWQELAQPASAVAVYRCGSLELASKYGVVELDEGRMGRILSFEEKPAAPRSDLVATATYLYHREHAALIDEYLASGQSPDQPGKLVAWLYSRVPVYGYSFGGAWQDIGDAEQLLAADNRLRELRGLPVRASYSLA